MILSPAPRRCAVEVVSRRVESVLNEVQASGMCLSARSHRYLPGLSGCALRDRDLVRAISALADRRDRSSTS